MSYRKLRHAPPFRNCPRRRQRRTLRRRTAQAVPAHRRQPLIFHTLLALCRSPRIDRVLVVLAPDDAHWSTYDWQALGPKLETVAGGATRAESVLAGLRAAETAAADDDWVLVRCGAPVPFRRNAGASLR